MAKSGILIVDKPTDISSHSVVSRVRRLLGTRDVGHAGTLDPMATGVLVVAVGEATKLVTYLVSDSKTYEATVLLGQATDSLDAKGVLTETRAVDPNWQANVEQALMIERTRTQQIPPIISAIHVDGERAYKLARRGETPELAPREVSVRSAALTATTLAPPTLSVTLDVSKGYYVRSFARDVAETLGTVGHLTALRRTRSGDFLIGEAVPLDTNDLAAHVIPLAQAARRALPAIELSAEVSRDVGHGKVVNLGYANPPAGVPHAWFAADGHLVAIGVVDESGAARVLRGFNRDTE